MKIYILIPYFLLFATAVSAQQIVSTKGDKIEVSEVKIEPWKVMKDASLSPSNTDNIYQQGNVAIGNLASTTASTKLPKLQINAGSGEEALRIEGLKDLASASDSFSGGSASSSNSYYDLKISEQGYIRRVRPTEAELNQTILYDLNSNYETPGFSQYGAEVDFPYGRTNDNRLTNMKMNWNYKDADGINRTASDVILPNNGAYVFSFRLYGYFTNGTKDSSIEAFNSNDGEARAFYIYAFKNGITFDRAELNLIMRGQGTYSVNLTVSGKKGDRISFSILRWIYGPKWTLTAAPGLNANKTSMFFWKL